MLPLIFAGVTAVASITGTYLYTRNHYEIKLAERAAEHANQMAEANTAALAETQRLQAAKDAALKAAASRQRSLAADVASGRDALGRLRDAADGAIRDAQNSHSACVEKVDAFADVFGQCRVRLRDVAEAADDHAEDARTLIESYPTQGN